MARGHKNMSASQKSFSDTWHSSIIASTRFRGSNVKASLGFAGVDGHNLARARVTDNPSQLQHINPTSCCNPVNKKN